MRSLVTLVVKKNRKSLQWLQEPTWLTARLRNPKYSGVYIYPLSLSAEASIQGEFGPAQTLYKFQPLF